MAKMPTKLEEHRKKLVDKIVEEMQAGKVIFWDRGYTRYRMVNAITGKPYRGGNNLTLMMAVADKGYQDPRWCTFRQATSKGWHVKRGEKGTPIEVWKSYEELNKKELEEEQKKAGEKSNTDEKEDSQKEKERRTYYKVASYTVFNAQQIEGIPPLQERSPEEIEAEHKKQITALDTLVKNSEAEIFHDQLDQNYYDIATDTIHIVPQDKFKTVDMYYATASHEIAHSTGAEHRLNRKFMERNGAKAEYAKEELRAELASMFIQQDYNVRFDEKHFENHSAYVRSWIQALQKDPDELYRAARDAEKAVDYMKTRMIERDLQKEVVKEKTQELAPAAASAVSEVKSAEEAVEVKKEAAERPKHNIQRTIEIKPKRRKVIARRKPANEKGRSLSRSR